MMRTAAFVLGAGFLLFPLMAVWRPQPRWMNRCWLAFFACFIGLIGLAMVGGDHHFRNTVQDRQAELQRVEILEAKAFTAAFQHVLIDGQMYAVTADTEFEMGERVWIRLMQHWLFSDTRLFICSERGCSAAQPISDD